MEKPLHQEKREKDCQEKADKKFLNTHKVLRRRVFDQEITVMPGMVDLIYMVKF